MKINHSFFVAGMLALLFLSCLDTEKPNSSGHNNDDTDLLWSGSLYQECDSGRTNWLIRLEDTSNTAKYVLPVGIALDSVHVGASFEQDRASILIDSIDSVHVHGSFEIQDTNAMPVIAGRFTLRKVLEAHLCETSPGLSCSDSLPPIQLAGEWTWRMEPYTSSEQTPNSVVWTGERLVAAGAGGTILTSSDGLSWEEQASGTTKTLFGLACAPHGLVAVGADGIVLRSPDGLTWSVANSGTSDTLTALIWAKGRFVALGSADTIHTSPDGATWTAHLAGAQRLRAVAASGARIVAVSDAGIILSSSDGLVWTQHASNTTLTLITIAWTGSHFLAYSNMIPGVGRVSLKSPEGSAWSSFQSSGSAQVWPYFLTLKRFGVFLAGKSRDGNGYDFVMVSNNGGETWISKDMPRHFFPADYAWTGERLVVVGYNGGIVTLP